MTSVHVNELILNVNVAFLVVPIRVSFGYECVARWCVWHCMLPAFGGPGISSLKLVPCWPHFER